MSEYLKSISDAQVAEMRDHFYKLGWGQNETMWKCWNQALDYLAPQLSASQQTELNAVLADNALLRASVSILEARIALDTIARVSTDPAIVTARRSESPGNS